MWIALLYFDLDKKLIFFLLLVPLVYHLRKFSHKLGRFDSYYTNLPVLKLPTLRHHAQSVGQNSYLTKKAFEQFHSLSRPMCLADKKQANLSPLPCTAPQWETGFLSSKLVAEGRMRSGRPDGIGVLPSRPHLFTCGEAEQV